jgi:uncharacterized protein (TIGR03118 family)
VLAALAPSAVRADYLQTNLVSDGAVPAAWTDTNLKNPWGVSFGGGGPFWVSDQKTGVTTLYNSTGTPLTFFNIPGGSPTGQLNNKTSDFTLADGKKALFLFASLKGTISGWNGDSGTTAEQKVTTANAAYTGIAAGTIGSNNFLYAANARGSDGNSSTGIDVFDKNFHAVSVPGGFTHPALPAGYTPYNIANIGGTLFVTYAKFGSGGGFVDAFDTNGNFLYQLKDHGSLSAPWGVVMAPSTFGSFANDLLVGNFFNGRITAFDPTTHEAIGQLKMTSGQLFSEPGLWGLTFGNGGLGGDKNTLFFSAGINHENDGLFGSLKAAPEPGAGILLGLGGVLLGAFRLRCRIRGPVGRRAN